MRIHAIIGSFCIMVTNRVRIQNGVAVCFALRASRNHDTFVCFPPWIGTTYCPWIFYNTTISNNICCLDKWRENKRLKKVFEYNGLCTFCTTTVVEITRPQWKLSYFRFWQFPTGIAPVNKYLAIPGQRINETTTTESCGYKNINSYGTNFLLILFSILTDCEVV